MTEDDLRVMKGLFDEIARLRSEMAWSVAVLRERVATKEEVADHIENALALTAREHALTRGEDEASEPSPGGR